MRQVAARGRIMTMIPRISSIIPHNSSINGFMKHIPACKSRYQRRPCARSGSAETVTCPSPAEAGSIAANLSLKTGPITMKFIFSLIRMLRFLAGVPDNQAVRSTAWRCWGQRWIQRRIMAHGTITAAMRRRASCVKSPRYCSKVLNGSIRFACWNFWSE